MKPNPNKCVFRVPFGKLLDFIVSQRGIEEGLENIKALDKLEVPTTLMHVQKLVVCVASPSRFISRLAEKALPLYRPLKKSNKFEWTSEVRSALADVKRMLGTNPS